MPLRTRARPDMNSYRNSDPCPPIMQGSPPPAAWRIPPLDWDRPPWNRRAFRNLSHLVINTLRAIHAIAANL